MSQTRQLAAIMFTDIVGYSAFMGRDEEGAMQLLELSRHMQQNLVALHEGKWIKELGDGVIIVFDSVLNAVKCAVEIQNKAKAIENLSLKIAIHSGEILMTENDVFGDSVNLTSRIEQLAQKDSIILSGTALSAIVSIASVRTSYLGDFTLKNIKLPVALHAIVGDGLVVPSLNVKKIHVENNEKDHVDTIDNGHPFIKRVRAIVKENMANSQLSVAYLCQELGVSRPQLYRKIQAETGFAPSDFIREIRLLNASELIKRPDNNVSEAAYQSGFNNLSYFSKCFQERFGVLPSAYTSRETIYHIVPAAVNEFFGRTAELHDLLEKLNQTRLLTLTGSGGTGKTRLALELLRTHGDQFTEGVYFVQLAPVTSVDQVISKVAQVLRIQQNPAKPTFDSIVQFVGKRAMLLVLDNFEHVIEAAGSISTLLENCPAMRILVTSRVILNLAAEAEYVVPLLEIPDRNSDHSVDELSKFSSIQLFVERGKSALASFALNDANKEDVVAICHKLDGLPLALELAATRLKIFSPSALLSRLEFKLDILSSTSSSVPDRHKTLRNAIDWSYSLLTPSEQTLFRRLSLFSGGSTIAAAEAICFEGYQDNLDIIDLLASLVDKSLLQRADQHDGEPRFLMLETVRAYGLERLQKSLEMEKVHGHYLSYYERWISEQKPKLTGRYQGKVCDALEGELDNIRSILDWAVKNVKANFGLEVATSLWRFWTIRSMMREGHSWLTRLLSLPTDDKLNITRCDALNACGIMLASTKHESEANELLQESLLIARKLDYGKGLGQVLNHLGWISILRNQFVEADQHISEALEVNAKFSDQRAISVSYNNWAWSSFQQAKLAEARDLQRKVGQLRSSIDDQRGHAFAIINEGYVGMFMGDYENCHKLTRQALIEVTKIGDDLLVAWANTVSAYNHFMQGHFELAKTQNDLALPAWESTGTGVGIGHSYWIDCKIHFIKGNLDLARERLQQLNQQSIATGVDLIIKSKFIAARLVPLEEAIEIAKTSFVQILDRHNFLWLPESLELLSTLYFDSGQHVQGLKMMAWATQFRTQHQMLVPPVDYKEISDLRLRYQQHFGDSVYKQTCSDIANMSFEDCETAIAIGID